MVSNIFVSPNAWVLTDTHGKIETISPNAREILGVGLGRGNDLSKLLPIPRKAMLLDMEIALTGWPARRTVVLQPFGVRPFALTYRVSQRLKSGKVALFWQLDRAHDEVLDRSA
jgi:hypothetical protein